MSERELIVVGKYECITKGCPRHHEFCARVCVEGKPSPKCRKCKQRMRLYRVMRRVNPPTRKEQAAC